MAAILQIIGAFSIGTVVSYFIWKGWKKLKTVKFTNPLKSYVRKIVLEYLKELQN